MITTGYDVLDVNGGITEGSALIGIMAGNFVGCTTSLIESAIHRLKNGGSTMIFSLDLGIMDMSKKIISSYCNENFFKAKIDEEARKFGVEKAREFQDKYGDRCQLKCNPNMSIGKLDKMLAENPTYKDIYIDNIIMLEDLKVMSSHRYVIGIQKLKDLATKHSVRIYVGISISTNAVLNKEIGSMIFTDCSYMIPSNEAFFNYIVMISRVKSEGNKRRTKILRSRENNGVGVVYDFADDFKGVNFGKVKVEKKLKQWSDYDLDYGKIKIDNKMILNIPKQRQLDFEEFENADRYTLLSFMKQFVKAISTTTGKEPNLAMNTEFITSEIEHLFKK